MNALSEISKAWKKKADELLKEKEIVATLSKFGVVHFTGAYAYDLMMHGDIDISVVRSDEFAVEEVFEIYKALYFQGKFRSYFIGGDWDDPRKGKEFPEGYYVGLKEKVGRETWKLDIWFVSKAAFEKRVDNPKLKTMSGDQKELILECKKYRNEHKIKMTGQEIYGKILDGTWKNLEDFKKTLKSNERKV